MSITDRLQAQGGKPSGLVGTIAGRLMNRMHRRAHRWGLDGVPVEVGSVCLDIGCGGGNTVRALACRVGGGKVCGLDHSAKMVALSKRVNRAALERGTVEIDLGSVSVLPYSDSTFDVALAFETIQFWPDIANDLLEVRRVLKPNGTLVIINRYPPDNSKWADVLTLKSEADYRAALTEACFREITADRGSRKSWIKVAARR